MSLPHYQYWALGKPDNAFRDRADQQPSDASAAMRRNHDQVGVEAFGERRDFLPGIADEDVAFEIRQPGGGQAFRELGERCLLPLAAFVLFPHQDRLGGRELDRVCALDGPAQRLLESAMQDLGLSARAYDRIRRVSRTIADFDGVDRVGEAQVAEAIHYRILDRIRQGAAA